MIRRYKNKQPDSNLLATVTSNNNFHENYGQHHFLHLDDTRHTAISFVNDAVPPFPST